MNALIELDDIEVHFKVKNRRSVTPATLRAVDGVSLAVERSQCLGVVGESGCGKSTLAGVLVGLTTPTAGQVRYDGQDIGPRRSKELRRRIQMVFQDPVASLNPRRRVRSVLAELIDCHGLVPDTGMASALNSLMEMVNLPTRVLDARPRELSGGQRQRVAIARALAVQPDVLVADEAVSALDVSAQATVVNLLADLRADLGLTIVFISHDLGIIRTLCDRVAVMYAGRVAEEGPADAIFATPRHPYTRALLKAAPDLRRRAAEPRVPALEGEPSGALDLITGCPFQPRCPEAEAICSAAPPPYVQHGSHRTACVHASDQLGPVPG
ncbi:ABC transporter ATP-binding protein [Streptomyces sp. 110]|uniref:ABC transporter ATP-binding protein n=1 Tax=Streptomyces endocoffeicus TaxID=2898945 RepID=A0ABS1PEU0_9ACTN|nr:ABC transporter ATP-binding protein [Streptomyces endocoffeicus]MBL1110897.1 ABC transporter ATP-binding protein [Streptomyces endocoffeicus]